MSIATTKSTTYKFVTADQFRVAARQSRSVAAGLAVRMGAVARVEAGPTSRTKKFTISTADVDRAGDTINQDGWDTSAYLKNPVVLWSHRDRELPIAKTLQLAVESGALTAVCEFATADMNPLAESILQMVSGGFLRACSVGFVPLEWSWVEEAGGRFGIDYKRQELLEWSITPVPCNPNCLGMGDDEEEEAAAKAADAATLLALERMAKQLGRKLVESNNGVPASSPAAHEKHEPYQRLEHARRRLALVELGG